MNLFFGDLSESPKKRMLERERIKANHMFESCSSQVAREEDDVKGKRKRKTQKVSSGENHQ